MKFAVLTDALFPNVIGGIQKHSYYLVKYLAREAYHVDVYHSHINLDTSWDVYFSVEELKYINFIDFDYPRSIRFPGHYIYSSYKLSKLYYEYLKQSKYDMIYAQGFTGWYALIKEPFKRNMVTNLHGLEMFQKAINFKEYFKQIILRIPASKIIKYSQNQISLGGKLTEILASKGSKINSIKIIPNCVEKNWLLDNSLINNNKKLKFVFIGRYERRKGVEELSEVLSEIIENSNFEFHFVGPIPKNKKLDHPNIIYHGLIKSQEKIKNILDNSDILVSPSYSEGMPTVILEAMARGCAIIATNVGANCTMISSENGWLINGDIKSGLKEKMILALNLNKKKLFSMKCESTDKVEKYFTWSKSIVTLIQEIN